jgi:uncharacterized membrane-anchored protein
MFSMTFNLGYAETILIFMALFALMFAIKILQRGYHSIVYWITFTATAIVGTAISDFIDRTLGWGYAWGSLFLVTVLLAVIFAWYLKEKSVCVERIVTRNAEVYYWLAFLVANTLGTAAGDFLADDLGLGFMNGALLITGLLVVIALLHYFTKVSGTLLFWLAFVLTRPFGATFGDFLTKSKEQGGIHFGTIGSSLVFGSILVIAVYLEHRMVIATKHRKTTE